jgi:hypothetical protein
MLDILNVSLPAATHRVALPGPALAWLLEIVMIARMSVAMAGCHGSM